jgi:hypothetical protein
MLQFRSGLPRERATVVVLNVPESNLALAFLVRVHAADGQIRRPQCDLFPLRFPMEDEHQRRLVRPNVDARDVGIFKLTEVLASACGSLAEHIAADDLARPFVELVRLRPQLLPSRSWNRHPALRQADFPTALGFVRIDVVRSGA